VKLFLNHSIVGAPEALTEEFRDDRPYTFCRICGVVYQPELNRVHDWDYTPVVEVAAELLRREWSATHARRHTAKEHRQLQQSGNFLTPEAAYKLAPYGIAPLGDDAEVMQAMAEAPRAPVDGPETTARR